MPLSEGQTFAGYRIVRLLGSGGMGEVYGFRRRMCVLVPIGLARRRARSPAAAVRRIIPPPHRPNQRLLLDVKPNRTHTHPDLHQHIIIGLQ
jgi:hypothetical protein